MLPKTFSQKGQALILIVLAIVGMIGLVALAIDAGNAFSDRRNAQNAADTAALAAALAKVNNQSISDTSISDTVKNITMPNGYPDTRITVNEVNYVQAATPTQTSQSIIHLRRAAEAPLTPIYPIQVTRLKSKN